jgi:hypothetical protein
MRVIFFMMALMVVVELTAAAEERITVDAGGSLTIRTSGKQEVKASLFLWYDNWIWRNAEGLAEVGENRWSGTFTKRAEDGAGSIQVVQTLKRDGDAIRINYEFSRQERMDLTNGIWVSFAFPYPDYRDQNVVPTHGPPTTTKDKFEVAARGCTVNLSDAEAVSLTSEQATRFSSWVDPKRGTNINVRLARSELGESGSAGLTLRLVPAVKEVRSWQTPAQEAQLALGGVTASREAVGLFQPVEFTVDLSASYDNPFDPVQVALDADFITPSGRPERVPGFYYQGFKGEYESGEELLSLDGAPSWKVRYTPREAGDYSVTFRVRDRSGQVTSKPMSFRCLPSDSDGFVRTSSAQRSGPKHFRLDSGKTLFLIGHNVVSYLANLDDVFRKMSAGGENYTRFWMCSWSLGLEASQPVGRYRMHEAWRLDRTFDLAETHGIYIMLCLDTHQDFVDNWPANPYNALCGGPCKEPLEFLTNDEAKAFYKKRLRYVIARYGCRTNLLCWEFANEIEGFNGAQKDRPDVAKWHAEMGRFVREHDVFGHPITTSQWTTEGWPELWNLPEMEIVQTHYYANNRQADMAGDVARLCLQKLTEYPTKPHLFGEYGIADGNVTRQMDPTGVHLHNGNWAALMSGCASTPASWWHDSYIDALDLYHVNRGVANYVAAERLADRNWEPVQVRSVDYADSARKVEYEDLEFRGPMNGWAGPIPAATRFIVHRNGTVDNLGELPDVLHGQDHGDLHSPFVFEVDCRQPCTFSVEVRTVSAGGILEFQVDGQTARTVELPAGEKLGRKSEWQEQWQIWQTTYDEPYGIEVPAGRHTITLENTGKDWIQVGYLKLEGYVTNEQPPLRVLGMAADDRALLWVQNKEHTWFNVRDRKAIRPVEPTRLRLAGLADGPWHVEVWDTVAGKVTFTDEAQAKGGEVELALPAVAADLALKLVK